VYYKQIYKSNFHLESVGLITLLIKYSIIKLLEVTVVRIAFFNLSFVCSRLCMTLTVEAKRLKWPGRHTYETRYTELSTNF
jgi:hypothetical protein